MTAYSPFPLRRDAVALGLRPGTVLTSAGPVRVQVGRSRGGPATLLLHGAAGSWTTWTPLLAAAAAADSPLADVVALDLPGWGGSPLPAGGPQPGEPLGVGTLSQAVAEVARALGYERWRVLGHSLGGFVALDLAAREPVATRGVGLVSPTGPAVVEAIRRPWRGGAALPWFAGMLLAMRFLRATGHGGARLYRAVGRHGWLRFLAAPLFDRAREVDGSVFAALVDEVRPGSFVVAARAAAAYDLERWRGVRCPVRSVRGVRDVFVGPGDDAVLAALVPGWSGTVVPGAGHFAAVERPDEVRAALLPVLVAT